MEVQVKHITYCILQIWTCNRFFGYSMHANGKSSMVVWHTNASVTYYIVQIACRFEWVSHAVVENAAGRGPLGLMEGRGGMTETIGLEWVFPSTGDPGMAGTFFSELSENQSQRQWAGDWHITYFLCNHESSCLFMSRFPLKSNKNISDLIRSDVKERTRSSHFLTVSILRRHQKFIVSTIINRSTNANDWIWIFQCVSCIDMQLMHWYAIHV